MTRKSEPPVKKNAFVHKLYSMLQDPRLANLIWWSEDNPEHNTFSLHPDKEFASALTGYFKHGNVASFVRQLHMYGFHKVSEPSAAPAAPVGNVGSAADDGSAGSAGNSTTINPDRAPIWEFRHSSGRFKKDDEQSLVYIKRRSSSHSSRGAYDPPAPAPASYYMPQYYDPQMYYGKMVPGAQGAPQPPGYPQVPPPFPHYHQLAYLPPQMVAQQPPQQMPGAMPASAMSAPAPAHAPPPGAPPAPQAPQAPTQPAPPPPHMATPGRPLQPPSSHHHPHHPGTPNMGAAPPPPPSQYMASGAPTGAAGAPGAPGAPPAPGAASAPYQSPLSLAPPPPPPHPHLHQQPQQPQQSPQQPPQPQQPQQQPPPHPSAAQAPSAPPVPQPAPLAQAPSAPPSAPPPAPAPMAPPAPSNHQQPHFRKIWHSDQSVTASRPRNPSLLYDPLAPAPPPQHGGAPGAPGAFGAPGGATGAPMAHMAPPPTHGHTQLSLVSEQPSSAEGSVSGDSRSSSFHHHHQRPSAGSIGSVASSSLDGSSAAASAPPSVPSSATSSISGPPSAPASASSSRQSSKLPPPSMLRLSSFKFHESSFERPSSPPAAPSAAPSGAPGAPGAPQGRHAKSSVSAMIRPSLVELHLRHQSSAPGSLDSAMASSHSNSLFSNKSSVSSWSSHRAPSLGMAPFDDAASASPPLASRSPSPSVALDKRAPAARSSAVPVTSLLEGDSSAPPASVKRARTE